MRDWKGLARQWRLRLTPWPVYYDIYVRWYCDPCEEQYVSRFPNGWTAWRQWRSDLEEIECSASWDRIDRKTYEARKGDRYFRDIAAEQMGY